MRRKIVVLTGTRADYGLLKGILKRITTSSILELHLIAMGMHLSNEFGYTVNEIEKSKTAYEKAFIRNHGRAGASVPRCTVISHKNYVPILGYKLFHI